MRYLLDTNTWILYLKRTGTAVESRLRRTPASNVAVCSIVWAELLHGARKYEKRDERVQRIERTLGPYSSLPFDNAAARHYAVIRDSLETRGENHWPARPSHRGHCALSRTDGRQQQPRVQSGSRIECRRLEHGSTVGNSRFGPLWLGQ